MSTLTHTGFCAVVALYFALAVVMTWGAMWLYYAVTSYPRRAISVCIVLLGLFLLYNKVKRELLAFKSVSNSKSSRTNHSGHKDKFEGNPKPGPQSAPAPAPGPDTTAIKGEPGVVTKYILLPLIFVGLCLLFLNVIALMMQLCAKTIKRYPWTSALVLVLLFCLFQYASESKAEPVCAPTSEPSTGPEHPPMSDMGKAQRRGTYRAYAESEFEQRQSGTYLGTRSASGVPLQRSNYTGSEPKTGYTARYAGTSNARPFGYVNTLAPKSRSTHAPGTQFFGTYGQSARRNLDPLRYSNNRLTSEPQFGFSSLASETSAATRERTRLQPLMVSTEDEIKRYQALGSVLPYLGSSQPAGALAGSLQQPESHSVPVSAPAPFRATIPVFAPAPAPMVVDGFKPRRPRSPVLPPAPTSTYVHGPRATAGQLVRTRLDFAEMTLSLERRDVDMRGPGMGDMDVDKPRRARRKSDVEMAPPFVDEDAEMISADMLMEWTRP